MIRTIYFENHANAIKSGSSHNKKRNLYEHESRLMALNNNFDESVQSFISGRSVLLVFLLLFFFLFVFSWNAGLFHFMFCRVGGIGSALQNGTLNELAGNWRNHHNFCLQQQQTRTMLPLRIKKITGSFIDFSSLLLLGRLCVHRMSCRC